MAKQGAPSTTRKVLLRKARVFGATAAAAAAVAGGTTSATATAAPRGAAPGAGSMDHVVGQIQDNVQAALDKLSQQLAFGMVPIGTVIFVHKDLPGVPAVTENFQLCDGGKVTDNRSPLFGRLLPNIVAGGAGGVGLFVRGASTSGVVQAADQVVPAHAHAAGTLTTPAHAHSLNGHTHSVADTVKVQLTSGGAIIAFANTAVLTNSASTSTSNSPVNAGTTGGPSVANTATDGATAVTGSTASDGGSGAETRPTNVGLTPYMRIW